MSHYADTYIMRNQKQILALIPARGGSKRLPGKNTRLLAGKPLLAYSINAAQQSGIMNRIIVSTDSAHIATHATQAGAEVFKRPQLLAQDTSRSIDTVLQVLNTLETQEHWIPDIVIIQQPTSPLVTATDLKNGIALFTQDKCDYVVSVTASNPYWSFTTHPFIKPVMGWNTVINVRKQDLPPTYALNGAFYISTPATLQKNERFLNHKTLPLIMPQERSIDIDTATDFAFAEFLIGWKNESNTYR